MINLFNLVVTFIFLAVASPMEGSVAKAGGIAPGGTISITNHNAAVWNTKYTFGNPASSADCQTFFLELPDQNTK